MRTTRSAAARLLLALAALSLAASACTADAGGATAPTGGSKSLEGATIVVGSKQFDEQLLLGQIAIQALESAGAQVEDRTAIEGTEATRAALISGEIDLYWEYTGVGWVVLLGRQPTGAPVDAVELAEEVRAADLGNGVVWLDPAEANNAYAIATTAERAIQLGVENLSDYADLVGEEPADASLCATQEFLDREDGWAGVEDEYAFNLPDANTTALDLASVLDAVEDEDPCVFGEVFGTDGRIAADNLVIIEDDKGVFVKYNVALTVGREVYDEYGATLEAIFGPISQRLTNDKMIELNARVQVNGETPEAVATSFLAESGG